MTSSFEPHNLIARLLEEFETTAILLQIGIIALVLGAAWIIARFVRLRLKQARLSAEPDQEALRFGAAGLERIVFPVAAWVMLGIGRAILDPLSSVRLLDVVVPLVSSLVIVRIAVYALRHAFPKGSWVSTSERAIAWTVWVGMVLHIAGVLSGIRLWLHDVRLPMGKDGISLLNIVEGTLSIAVTMVCAVWLGRIVERRLMSLPQMDVNLRVVFSKLARAAFIVVGVLLGLSLVGIDITVLSVFGGALGVGLGLGLQKIAANYVSGFVILLDRSVKIGDLVTIDNQYGEVTRLTVRYVVVKSVDGTENIIPNETVITSTVVNHSYSDRRVRVDGNVQVGYGADVELALEALREVCRRHPRVLPSPEPVALVKGFGESGIDLEFYVWILDPEAGKGNLRSDLNLEVWKEFRRRGIEIPYPQRDIRIIQPASPSETSINP
ncbi:MAG: mechanosensitive ion channel [Betaproteobacteria bacterium]|nr:mechanosensitive ion channel [Betaproteobacteria bacterium]